ncbi:MAG TPA: hypothetical protein VGQ83_42070 [Polyangia bacterium]|jgi:hypothetical protein
MRRLTALLTALIFFVGSAFALAAPEAGAKLSPAALEKLADEITTQVVRIRHLPLKRPMAKGVLSKDEIRARLKERLQKEFPPQEIAAEGAVLRRLGLLPADVDYLKLILDLLSDQVVGFYDPFKKQLYIADWMPIDMQKPALAHEITHGLQDQHFDLKRYTSSIKGNGDRQLARAALVEGDGTGVMLEFALGVDLASLPQSVVALMRPMMQVVSSPVLQRTPRFMRESLMFPYMTGLDFIIYLRHRYSWTKINELYARPPESTEQVMHPEKYLRGEKPITITPKPLAALKGAREVWQDTFGEAQLRAYLEQYVDGERAAAAAAGWGGDRAVAYEIPGARGPAVVLLAAWDSEQDAIEFEEAQLAALAKLAGRPARTAGPAAYPAADGTVFAVERQGTLVLSGFGVPAALWPKVAAEVPRTWKAK